MLPTRLNLLSEQKQGYLHKMVYVQFFKHILEMLLFLLCIVGIVLVSAEMMLQNYFASITNQVHVSTKRIADLNTDITFINNTIQRTSIIQKEFTPWTEQIKTITNEIPAGIVLNAMRFDKKNKQISLSGQSTTRDTLLELTKRLEALPFIASASVPLSQLTQKENVGFTITIQTK